MTHQTEPSAVKRAIDAAGGPSAVSRKLREINPEVKLTPQAVSRWIASRNCPVKHVLALEKAQSAVTRYELRPDIYQKEKP